MQIILLDFCVSCDYLYFANIILNIFISVSIFLKKNVELRD